MIGRGEAFGAITVVNALATGKGAAIGIKLRTEAEVTILNKPVVEGEIYVDGGREKCDLKLVKAVKKVVFEKFKVKGGLRAVVRSDIPIARGLKSSSAAANALVKASLNAIGEHLDDLEVIKIGVEVAREAGVTITGAFDDACASMLGGLCITNNSNLTLLRRDAVDELQTVIYVPEGRVPTSTFSGANFRVLAPYVEEAFNLALRGDWGKAMVINGLIYTSFLKYDATPIFEALSLGAFTAGLSGTGPAMVAVTSDPDKLVEVWGKHNGRLILTEIRS